MSRETSIFERPPNDRMLIGDNGPEFRLEKAWAKDFKESLVLSVIGTQVLWEHCRNREEGEFAWRARF